jgi:LuxR family transcriptional regulator, quorum-sensing system regulator SolR
MPPPRIDKPIVLLTNAFDALERAKTPEHLRIEIAKFSRNMGFDKFAYVLMLNTPSYKQQHYILDGYPDDWRKRYLAQGYFKVDPVIRRIEGTSLPAIWSHEMDDDAKAEEFWDEARSYGVNAGLTFSVREQAGVTGIFSLARDRIVDLQGEDLAALIGRAQIFSGLLHYAVCRMELPKLLPQANVALTARERECLQWAAEGKTAWETGRILNISDRTAIFHLNNVVQKLGAANKSQAIVRAVALRLM